MHYGKTCNFVQKIALTRHITYCILNMVALRKLAMPVAGGASCVNSTFLHNKF